MSEGLLEAMRRPLSELELAVPTQRWLEGGGFTLIGEVVERTEAELMALPHYDRRSLRELKELLADLGLQLGMKVEGWR